MSTLACSSCVLLWVLGICFCAWLTERIKKPLILPFLLRKDLYPLCCVSGFALRVFCDLFKGMNLKKKEKKNKCGTTQTCSHKHGRSHTNPCLTWQPGVLLTRLQETFIAYWEHSRWTADVSVILALFNMFTPTPAATEPPHLSASAPPRNTLLTPLPNPPSIKDTHTPFPVFPSVQPYLHQQHASWCFALDFFQSGRIKKQNKHPCQGTRLSPTPPIYPKRIFLDLH